MKLTDTQWYVIEPLLPALQKGPRRQAPVHQLREILNGILRKLRSDAPWLPRESPPCQTCHIWLQYWRKTGAFEKILLALVELAQKDGKLDMSEGFIDATFAPAKKGGLV